MLCVGVYRRLQEAAEREKEIRAAHAELNQARAQLAARTAEVKTQAAC